MALATALREYPVSASARMTLSRVSGLTLGLLLSTRETVVCDTPANRATSRLSTILFPSPICQTNADSAAHSDGHHMVKCQGPRTHPPNCGRARFADHAVTDAHAEGRFSPCHVRDMSEVPPHAFLRSPLFGLRIHAVSKPYGNQLRCEVTPP